MAEEKATATAPAPSPKIVQILDLVSGLTLLEASELVKAFEQKFGVSAAPVAVAAGPAAPSAEGAPKAEEKTTFDVVLKEVGANKIQVIKAVRVVTTLGLKEAKALVDGAPGTVKEGATKEEAAKIKEEIEKAGGKVEIK